MITAVYTKETFKKLPEDFRLGAVISDGMWYSLPKWRKIARVSEETIAAWVEEYTAKGMLLQSATGAKSYRFSLEAIKTWYRENNLDLDTQLIDFLFPPRIWDEKTETEGFLEAPLREIGTVSFAATTPIAAEVAEALRGVGRIREVEPGSYKVYCLDARLAKEKVEKALEGKSDLERGRVRMNVSIKRRELVDFSPEFSRGLILFYKTFGRTLVKNSMETIRIFLPEHEDQEAQIVMWVLAAIEKFDETSSVPFSGYLNSVLRMWPYDLPYSHLGKELSNFQRARAKAVTSLAEGKERSEITNRELAEEMGYDRHHFETLEEKHRVWLGAKNATALTWAEGSEEKVGVNFMQRGHHGSLTPTDLALANKISLAIIRTGILTEQFDDAFLLMGQIDAGDINIAKIREVSEDFIQELGIELGIVENPS